MDKESWQYPILSSLDAYANQSSFVWNSSNQTISVQCLNGYILPKSIFDHTINISLIVFHPLWYMSIYTIRTFFLW